MPISQSYSRILKHGPGVPLVFSHGFLGKSTDWEAVSALLPPCLCIGIDLPGHGSSPFSETFDFLLPSSRFHLIGYSMGGRLALQYALRYPDRIDRLFLISTHPGLTSEEEKKQRLASDQTWADLLLHLPIDEFLIRWYDQPLFHGFKPDFSKRREQNRSELALAMMHYSLGKQPFCDASGAIHVVGEEDAKFRALHPTALVIPNTGHAIHLENPKALAQIIMERIL